MAHDKVTTQQAAEALGVSRDAIWRATKAGTIPSERIGRFYVISMSDAKAWVECCYQGEKAKRYPSRRGEVDKKE